MGRRCVSIGRIVTGSGRRLYSTLEMSSWNRFSQSQQSIFGGETSKSGPSGNGKLPNFHPVMVINTDQSGFNYEFFSGCTLSYRGENQTPIAIKSMNKTSHSYTIQPSLSSTRHLQSPPFICLQEVGGKMGERVKQ